MRVREVFLVAGEVSGDLHAAAVARALAAQRPDLSLAGIGSTCMAAAGVALVERSERLAALGFIEVIRQVPHHWRLLREVRARLRSGRVSLLVLLDYPGFNLKLAAAAHDAGVPVLYYITPQVWAWGPGRLAEIARIVTKAAVILPFEEALLRKAGVDATFVGHPLLDHAAMLPDRTTARARLGIDPGARVLALFPGSRGQEVARHLDVFVAAARRLEARIPGLQPVVSVAPGMTIDAARCPYPQRHDASYDVLRAADAALCKSGTTTLEAAVAECPLVIAYKTNALTAVIARRVIRVPHIGLVNIVAQREVAREFWQEFATAEALADAVEPLLDAASAARRRMVADLAQVHASLGTPGASARVAQLASEMLPP
ncbi:MAG: lipid-A-disaccharide synthase [Gemmatimonadetes bacterium]|nr:lipid-A-disaccharide synthase [Gemmatimonadota bacterium]